MIEMLFALLIFILLIKASLTLHAMFLDLQVSIQQKSNLLNKVMHFLDKGERDGLFNKQIKLNVSKHRVMISAPFEEVQKYIQPHWQATISRRIFICTTNCKRDYKMVIWGANDV